MHLPADSMPWSIIHPANTPTAMRQATPRTQASSGHSGDVSGPVGPLVDRKPAGFRPALAALLLAAMVAPLGAWAADGQPAEGTITPPSASATTDSNTGNGDAAIPRSGGGSPDVGSTEGQVSTDIQNSQGQGRFVLGEELPKARARNQAGSGSATAGDGSGQNQPAADGERRAQGGQDQGQASSSGADAQGYRPMDWEVLIPKDWEPLRDFKSLNFNGMSDSDPRAIAALRKLQKAWKNAPLNPAIQNEKIVISGFIVPLDSSDSSTIEEFLLVPYFGACIHVPPPPSNQVIHVVPAQPLKGFQMMDPVTVTGDLSPSRIDTPYGSAGYEMQAKTVAPYEDPEEAPSPAHP
jgi:hypothetical protein